MLGVSPAIVPWIPGEQLVRGTMPVLQVGKPLDVPIRWGRPDVATGRAMGSYIEKAVALTVQSRCSAMVTCPISKKSLQEAGYDFPGHTEMLAALTNTQTVWMMMAGPKLRITSYNVCYTKLLRKPWARCEGRCSRRMSTLA